MGSSYISDTICALATPPGTGGLAVVRVSGTQSFSLTDQFFRGKVGIEESRTHTLHYGWWVWEGVSVDSVTATVFRNPHSYTGEDVVEIGCHGGKHVVDQILSSLVSAGARMATAGEFTKRAFLNKRLDLTQAEAVADIIHSQTTIGARTAARQLSGGFTRRLGELREQLTATVGLIELELDFAEEDVEFVRPQELRDSLLRIRAYASSLVDAAKTSEQLRSGLVVAVIGYPNAGKSALFNAILGKQRAIVSDRPGTTRDYLDESITMDGFVFRLVDTAGIRSTNDAIELEGISLAQEMLVQADVILVLNDSSQGLLYSNSLVQDIQQRFATHRVVVVQSKADLLSPTERDTYQGVLVSSLGYPGIAALTDLLLSIAHEADSVQLDVLVNQRHAKLLESLVLSLDSALHGLDSGLTSEYLSVDLRASIRILGEITGETWNVDILEDVFSRFCIGK